MATLNPFRWKRAGYGFSRVCGHLLSHWRNGALNILFPPFCAYCGADIQIAGHRPQMCDECKKKFAPNADPFCPRCGCPVTHADSDCSRCRDQRLSFDAIIPLGPYRSDLRAAILRMKHFHEQPLAAAVGELIADRVAAILRDNRPSVIVPLPMFWLRRMSRGMSSPEVMAEVVSSVSNVPAVVRLLVCRRKTKKQSMLSPAERQRNVKGAFRVSPGYSLHGMHVVLVDDVVTTGATANEASKALRRAGANRITVAVVARAID